MEILEENDVVENDNNDMNGKNKKLKGRLQTETLLLKRSTSSLSSTGENVKKKLESQIKSIIKVHDNRKKQEAPNYKKISKEAFNHSLKDMTNY